MELNEYKFAINGYQSFSEIKTILNNNQKLKPLEFLNDLTIDMNNDFSTLTNYDFMADQFVIKKMRLCNDFENFGFHSDFNYRNGALSGFLQILDDSNNNRPRRKNILNSAYSYVGISIGKIDLENFAIYCIFCG